MGEKLLQTAFVNLLFTKRWCRRSQTRTEGLDGLVEGCLIKAVDGPASLTGPHW